MLYIVLWIKQYKYIVQLFLIIELRNHFSSNCHTFLHDTDMWAAVEEWAPNSGAYITYSVSHQPLRIVVTTLLLLCMTDMAGSLSVCHTGTCWRTNMISLLESQILSHQWLECKKKGWDSRLKCTAMLLIQQQYYNKWTKEVSLFWKWVCRRCQKH